MTPGPRGCCAGPVVLPADSPASSDKGLRDSEDERQFDHSKPSHRQSSQWFSMEIYYDQGQGNGEGARCALSSPSRLPQPIGRLASSEQEGRTLWHAHFHAGETESRCGGIKKRLVPENGCGVATSCTFAILLRHAHLHFCFVPYCNVQEQKAGECVALSLFYTV
jgi:hypothetical protein